MSPQIQQLITNINTQIIAPIILLLFVLALVLFFWGLIDFIRGGNSGESEKKEKAGTKQAGREHMLWGIIGIFIMVSAWGIITIITNTFGIDTPTFPSGVFQ